MNVRLEEIERSFHARKQSGAIAAAGNEYGIGNYFKFYFNPQYLPVTFEFLHLLHKRLQLDQAIEKKNYLNKKIGNEKKKWGGEETKASEKKKEIIKTRKRQRCN